MTTATLQEQLFRLPDLGEGLTEAEIVEWKVAVGDTVTIDQIVIEVETAKAAVEVPVPYAGTVLRLHAEAGTALAVGEPLITVGAGVPGEAEGTAGGSGDPSPGGHAAGSASADPAADRYREEEQAGSGNVLIGYGTGHGPAPRRRRRRTGAATGGGTRTEAAQPFGPHAPRVVSPLVRRMAREHGIDLAGVAPSGPAGIVLRRDVEQAVARVRQTSTDPEAAPDAPAQQASADLTPHHRGGRRRTARNASRCAECAAPWRTSSPAAGPRSPTPPPGSMWTRPDCSRPRRHLRPPNLAAASGCWPCWRASALPG